MSDEYSQLGAADQPMPAADPVNDKSTVFIRRFFPGEVAGVERMDLAMRKEVVPSNREPATLSTAGLLPLQVHRDDPADRGDHPSTI